MSKTLAEAGHDLKDALSDLRQTIWRVYEPYVRRLQSWLNR